MNFQHNANSIPNKHWDVIVIGAGPSGAMTAAHLAAKHHRVLLLDHKKFPREKICGDGLLPDSLRCLDTIDIGERIRSLGRRISICSLISPSQKEVKIPGEYLTIKRSLLDMMVVERAVKLGTFFGCGAVKNILVRSNGLVSVSIKGSDKQFSARIGILATGANIHLARKLGWHTKNRPTAVALRCYVHSTYNLDQMIVSYDKSIKPGYAWIFPMRNKAYNLGCGVTLNRLRKGSFNLKEMFFNFIKTFPPARKLMNESKLITPIRWATLRHDFQGLYPFIKGPVIAVGETIGTTLPFLGEGIGKAMESGCMAAEVVSASLDSNDLNEIIKYEKYVNSDLKPRYQGYRMAEKWLESSWLMDLLVYRSGRSNYAKNILAGIIDETCNPKDLVSLKGILKTFWK